MLEQERREEEEREQGRRMALEARLRRRVTEVMPPTGSVGPIDTSYSTTSTLFTAGALSGGASKLLTAPIDRVKIIYQVNSDPRHAFTLRRGLATARHIVIDAGVIALWRGNSAAIARDVPYASIVFSSYAMCAASLGYAPRR